MYIKIIIWYIVYILCPTTTYVYEYDVYGSLPPGTV